MNCFLYYDWNDVFRHSKTNKSLAHKNLTPAL